MSDISLANRRFQQSLEQVLAPLGKMGSFAACLLGEEEHEWVVRSSQLPADLLENVENRTLQSKGWRVVRHQSLLSGESEQPLHILFCAAENMDWLLELAEVLHQKALEQETVEAERDALCEELGQSYESLASVYEIGTDPTLLLNSGRALERILDRVAAISPDMRGVVWLVQGDQLVPIQWRNTPEPDNRDRSHGLLARCLEQGRGIIVNTGRGPNKYQITEPEMLSAQSIAVAPLLSRDKAIGCLAAWREDPCEFDSQLMGLLSAMGSQAAMVLENERLYKEILDNERLRAEIEIGGRIQQSLLVGRPPAELSSLDVGLLSIPSRHVDGDFCEFFQHSRSCLDVLVGDVMGKGLPAALVGAAVKSEFLRFSSYGKEADGKIATTQDIVSRVHHGIAPQLIELECFVTACYARFDLQEMIMHFVDCGHTKTLHLRSCDNKVFELQDNYAGCVNLPMGMDSDAEYLSSVVKFDYGDIFLFYSDGVTEATSSAGEMYGVESLVQCLQKNAGKSADAIVNAVRREVAEFADASKHSDDLTCLVVKVGEEEEFMKTATDVLEFPAQSGYLERVRSFIGGLCQRTAPELEGEELYRIQLAVVEAVSNILEHSYGEDRAGDVRIEARMETGGLRFCLTDFGRSFNPDEVDPPALDGSKSSGFGIFLMQEIMDEVRYESIPGGPNHLHLFKNLDRKPVRRNS